MKNHISYTSLTLGSLSNFKWSLLLLGLLCLFGCETYQHENLKVGQSETVAVEVMEKYLDTKVVIERLEGQGTKVQVDSLLQLTEMMKNFDEEVAIAYAQRANLVATEKGQDVSYAISRYYITMLRERQQIFGEGLEELIVDAKMCRRVFTKEKRQDWLINVNNLIGIIYYRQSENDSAIVYLNKALELLEVVDLGKEELLNLKGDVFHDIGNVYSTIDTLMANKFYQKSFSLYESTNNNNALNRLKVALGFYYFYDIGSFEQSETFFQQSLSYAKENKNSDLLVKNYRGLAELNIELFKGTNDKQYFDTAQKFLREQLSNLNENFYFSYQLIAHTYQAKLNQSFIESETKPNIKERYADLDSAIINYKKAVLFAQKEGAINAMKTINDDLSALCNWRKTQLGIGCDSLLGISSLGFLNENYSGIVNNIKEDLKLANQKNRQYEKREQEIVHQQRVFRNWMITGIGTTLSVLIFLIILQRLQQKRLIAKMEALRAQINPHFISNSLNAIESLVNLNKRKEASKYLVHFSRLSRRILNGSREAFVSLTEELETLEHFLALEQLRFRDKLHFDIAVQEGLNPKLIQVPAMIMQPYVENAIWHGIKPKEEPGLLKIIIEKDKKNLVCIIEDNGIGRAKAKALKENSVLKHKSQGMQISKERLEALGKMKGAKIQMIDLADKEGKAIGTRVILRFPLKYKK